MINLKGYNFLFGKKAVSPVIGTILMVAITVIMAAIVGGFVYQTARPKVPPAVSSSLADDALVSVNGSATTTNNNTAPRIAKLMFEGGRNVAISELSALVSYTDNGTVERDVVLDGASWVASSNVSMGGANSGRIRLMWVDADASKDVSPGDRLDFYETFGVDAANSGTAPTGVKRSTDFTVKILHKATEAFIADHTIRVY